MTASQVYEAYLVWLGGHPPKPAQQIFDLPVANCDLFEDESRVVNRLFFLVPDTFGGTLRCFSFFEENTFLKDSQGDMTLAGSTLHLLRE